jgi:hypothetical protein
MTQQMDASAAASRPIVLLLCTDALGFIGLQAVLLLIE